MMASLGTGELGLDGSVSFSPSPKASRSGGYRSFFSSSTPSNIADGIMAVASSTTSTVSSARAHIIGRCCSFLRVADLAMDDESVTVTSITTDITYQNELHAGHTHRPVVNPPPGIEIDPKERWIALCTTLDNDPTAEAMDVTNCSGVSEHTPIAPVAIERLANYGWTTALDEAMWEPDSKSDKLIKKATDGSEWMKDTFQEGLQRAPAEGTAVKDDILVWQGSYKHGFYGSEVPAIRSAGVIDTSAKKLMELLVDSSRVKEYNKMSLGRTDLITFEGNMEEGGPFGKSITKVMRSESKPPMIAKLSLTSVLHAKKLADGSGYLIVNRSVHRPEEEASSSAATSVASSVKTEIVMGVNLLLDFDQGDKCLMININHMRSPMVPMYVAKRVAVSSATKFINDVRASV
jgi:hypothetical protein